MSLQKNIKKIIKIWNNSYRETSKGEQKTPGLKKSKLISLDKVGQKIRTFFLKMAENFRTGAYAIREGESCEGGKVFMH